MDTDRVESDIDASGDKLVESKLTEQIIGAAFEVHRELGSGFLEKVYEVSLGRELNARGLDCSTQAEVKVCYKGVPVGNYIADLLVEGKVICEIKALSSIRPEHEAQLLNYLKASGIRVGLLINFGTRRCQFKRMVY
jgi:GxxExxY protein